MKAWIPVGLFPVLAHQGGWDESLLVVGPLFVIGLALWLVNRRVSSRLSETETSTETQATDPEPASGRSTSGGTSDR